MACATLHGAVVALQAPAEQADVEQTDEFRMYVYKVQPCTKRFGHDWTDCAYTHPGEKAARRCPKTYRYAAVACPDVRKQGRCPRRDSCPYAHSTFEFWLHPGRYRTQLCSFGANCKRNVCFFAHSLAELRTPPCPEDEAAATGAASLSQPSSVLNASLAGAAAAAAAAVAASAIASGGAPLMGGSSMDWMLMAQAGDMAHLLAAAHASQVLTGQGQARGNQLVQLQAQMEAHILRQQLQQQQQHHQQLLVQQHQQAEQHNAEKQQEQLEQQRRQQHAAQQAMALQALTMSEAMPGHAPMLKPSSTVPQQLLAQQPLQHASIWGTPSPAVTSPSSGSSTTRRVSSPAALPLPSSAVPSVDLSLARTGSSPLTSPLTSSPAAAVRHAPSAAAAAGGGSAAHRVHGAGSPSNSMPATPSSLPGGAGGVVSVQPCGAWAPTADVADPQGPVHGMGSAAVQQHLQLLMAAMDQQQAGYSMLRPGFVHQHQQRLISLPDML